MPSRMASSVTLFFALPACTPAVVDATPPQSTAPRSAPSAAQSIASPSPSTPSRGIRSTPHARAATECVRPLADLCARGCPSWDAALAETLRAADAGYAPERCSGIGSGDVAIGACGAYRFVEDGDCLSGMTRFFDRDGKLVGAYAWGDVKRPCGLSTSFGHVPDCR
jgi:hypothetical protein